MAHEKDFILSFHSEDVQFMALVIDPILSLRKMYTIWDSWGRLYPKLSLKKCIVHGTHGKDFIQSFHSENV